MKNKVTLDDHVSRVLIVDDELLDRRVAEAMLTLEGYEILTAESGAEALAMIAMDPPDLILLDIIMPEMDGYEVARRLKGQGKNQHIPIIMLSGLDHRDERMLGLQAGVEDFLSKPVDRSELCLRVKNLLKFKLYGDFYTRCCETLESEAGERTIQLRESEAFLGSAIDALPEHICIIGPEGEFIAVNDSWKRFARDNGLLVDDFITGFNYLDVCAACVDNCGEAETALQGIRSIIAGEATEFLMEYTCHSPMEKRWFTMRATGMDTKIPASVVITHFNVTERKNMEAALLHKHKLESMGQLAGGVAHDFNNILTVIKSYGDLLLNEPDLAPVHRRDIEEISRAADRATNLTRQLLAFSRKETVTLRVFDLNTRISNVQSMLDRLIGEDVELVVTLANDQLPIIIDPTHLEQVVVNLVVNARDSMPRGGVLTVQTYGCDVEEGSAELGPDLTPGAYVVLSVTDTGTGMDAETVTRIFEPFFTTKGEGMGTGLGLSTVFGIVSQAGGCVRVTSTQGYGTSFRLYFPVAQMPVNESPVVPIKAIGDAPLNARILFVEDEEALRKLGRRILEKNGFQVSVAADCAEAIQLCSDTICPFDLVCIDVVLPGMGGGELAVKLLARHPSLKILMMSGFNGDELLRRGIGESTIPFIQKPYAPAALVLKIREVLAGKTLQSSPYLRLA